MKKKIILLTAVILSMMLYAFNQDSGTNQKPVYSHAIKNVKSVYNTIEEKKATETFPEIKIFKFKNKNIRDNDFLISQNSGVKLTLSKNEVQKLLGSKSGNLTFKIPVSMNADFELELTRSFPLSNDFVLTEITSGGKIQTLFNEGIHYSGIIKGRRNSIASISIFENFVMGIISDNNGNYNLGPVKDSKGNYTNEYVFYNSSEAVAGSGFKCGADGIEESLIRQMKSDVNETNTGSDNPALLPVKLYFEADFQMYSDNQNNSQNVANLISGFFNSVKTIYQNEGIPMEISSIGIWTQADPYRNLNDSYVILKRFGGISKDNFHGNLAHLLSTRNAQLGGIAWIRVLCASYSQQDSSGRYGFSNIENNFSNYPAYSWTVNVVTHELGHNMGSRHTHACNWPVGSGGSIQSIDSCYYAEGNCFTSLRPRIGTIMSYCHLWTAQQGGGINLSSGFGQLPGDTIRLRYAQAGCLRGELNSSEAPYSFDLSQNFPNPFNPETVIRFAVPEESVISIKVYDISGKLIASLINNQKYSIGYFDVKFNAADYGLSSGIYFYNLTSGSFSESKRMLLVK